MVYTPRVSPAAHGEHDVTHWADACKNSTRRLKSAAVVLGSANARSVAARSAAEMPVEIAPCVPPL